MEVAMMEEWTEGRLDELSKRVDHGFDLVDQRFGLVDQRFDRVESEVHALRSEVKDEFKAVRIEMKAGLERVNDRIDSVQRAIFFGAISLTGAILAGFASICALIATQL
jgi:tetrahydromethanopterin S-methyltransferase subunit G